jgi:Tol biopolymer transport system component
MPDVKELFETTTRDLHVEPGALQRQHRRQRRHRNVRTAAVVAVVAAVVAAAGILLTSAWSLGDQRLPAQPPPAPSQAHEPYMELIDASTGRVMGGDGWIGNVAPDSRAAISPDGSRVAFVRPVKASEQMFLTSGQGYARRLTGPGKSTGCACGASQPAWSPDGRLIAFAGTDQTGAPGIFVLNVATGELLRVTRSHWFEATPIWSPDGRRIAFVRGTHDLQSLWIVNVASGDLTHVSTLPAANPAWSPDGTTIAFSRPGTIGLDSGIWLIHPDGSGLRRFANAAVTSDGNISWSPDGTKIAFAAPRTDGKAPFVDIDVVNVTTGEVRVLARGFDYPTWSPDGRSILVLGR